MPDSGDEHMLNSLLPQQKAAILSDALPWIQKFSGKTVVIKHGGSTMGSGAGTDEVLRDILLLKLMGLRPVIVHGGGKAITSWLGRLGIPARFVDGLRVTDAATMEVVEMVLIGQVNKLLVGRLNQYDGGRAIGLSGIDGNLLMARKRKSAQGDLGQVGDIDCVNISLIEDLLRDHYIPVIAPVGADSEGVHYNINADSAACAIAGALKAEKLILLTDVPGVIVEENGTKQVISHIDAPRIRELIAEGQISGGMVPKVEAGLSALADGVRTVHIIDGQRPHALLLEIFTSEGIGTMVINSMPDEDPNTALKERLRS